MGEVRSPLRITCRNCGHPVTFDIERQTYRCPMCSETSGIEETRRASLELRELHKEELHAQAAQAQVAVCSGCGAKTVFPQGEALSNCDFCGGRLVRADAGELGFEPDLVIPFMLTEQEAKERLREWAKEHPKTGEARMINSSSDDIRGYYLPYEIVSGPMEFKANRAGLSRSYRCRGYIEDTAVNCVREMDYSVLDAAEPFDLNSAVPFEYGYIAGHRALISDISDNDIDRRVRRRAEKVCLPTVQRTLQDSDVRIKVTSDRLLSASATLPMYVLKKGRLSAVVNGQTGRVAVSLKDKKKKPFPFWAVEAAVYTVAVTLLLCAIISFSWKYICMFGIFFGLMFFIGMGQDRAPIAARVIKRGERVRAHREDGELLISQGEESAPPCLSPVFYETVDGRETAVEYKFLTLRRILSLVIQSVALIFAPVAAAAVIAAVKAIASNRSVYEGIAGMDLRGDSVWFIFTVTFSLLFTTQSARIKAYDRPYIYELTQNGGRRLVGKPRDRRLLLAELVFTDVGTLKSAAKSMRGILIAIGTAVTFILSVWGMLSV